MSDPATPPVEPALDEEESNEGRSWWVALVIVAVPLLVVGAAVVLALATRSDDGGGSSSGTPTRPPETLTYVIPSGTAARMEAGVRVDDVIPEYLELVVGDTIVVENQDNTTHRFGPIVVRAGETTEVKFYEAGRYQGACTVGDHDTVTIQVT